MNPQADILSAAPKSPAAVSYAGLLQDTAMISERTESPWLSARPRALPPRISFIVLAWVLVQEVFGLSVIRAYKMSRFGFDTYQKNVRILLFLPLNRTRSKIKSHIGLKGYQISWLRLPSKKSSDNITRLFKEQDGVWFQFVKISYNLHKHKSILLHRNIWNLLQNKTSQLTLQLQKIKFK